ncbi:hypothetical protein CC79DRAFT_1055871 [Sarocladium strictum]
MARIAAYIPLFISVSTFALSRKLTPIARRIEESDNQVDGCISKAHRAYTAKLLGGASIIVIQTATRPKAIRVSMKGGKGRRVA